MPHPRKNPTILDLFDREDRIECDDAIESLKELCETRYYAGFTACTLAVLNKLETGCSRMELGNMLGHWLIEAQVHATMGIDRLDAQEIAERLQQNMPPEMHPGRN